MTDKPAANDDAAKLEGLPEGETPVAAAAPELVPAAQVTAALEACLLYTSPSPRD